MNNATTTDEVKHTTVFCKACGKDTAEMTDDEFEAHCAAMAAEKSAEFDALVARANNATP